MCKPARCGCRQSNPVDWSCGCKAAECLLLGSCTALQLGTGRNSNRNRGSHQSISMGTAYQYVRHCGCIWWGLPISGACQVNIVYGHYTAKCEMRCSDRQRRGFVTHYWDGETAQAADATEHVGHRNCTSGFLLVVGPPLLQHGRVNHQGCQALRCLLTTSASIRLHRALIQHTYLRTR